MNLFVSNLIELICASILSLYHFMCNILDYSKSRKCKDFGFSIVIEDAFNSSLEQYIEILIMMITSLLTAVIDVIIGRFLCLAYTVILRRQ
jgi:hypothetical protein